MLLPSAEGEGCSNDVLECGVGVSWAVGSVVARCSCGNDQYDNACWNVRVMSAKI